MCFLLMDYSEMCDIYGLYRELSYLDKIGDSMWIKRTQYIMILLLKLISRILVLSYFLHSASLTFQQMVKSYKYKYKHKCYFNNR